MLEILRKQSEPESPGEQATPIAKACSIHFLGPHGGNAVFFCTDAYTDLGEVNQMEPSFSPRA